MIGTYRDVAKKYLFLYLCHFQGMMCRYQCTAELNQLRMCVVDLKRQHRNTNIAASCCMMLHHCTGYCGFGRNVLLTTCANDSNCL